MSSSFLRHYDETKTLSYAIPLISPTWSDGIQNKDTWNSLTDFQRNAIEKAVKEAQNASIAYQLDTTLWALALNQSEGTNIHFLTDNERKEWKQEFYPKMLEAIVSKSANPTETRQMIKKIEALVDDLRWQ